MGTFVRAGILFVRAARQHDPRAMKSCIIRPLPCAWFAPAQMYQLDERGQQVSRKYKNE